jgi:tetratricopeptide (TPR) repeat protein
MRGPCIKKDKFLHGPSVLDVAPTILTLYGLPVGEDMDGKVLTQAFVNPPEVATIPSWEDVPGNDGRHPADTRPDPVASHEAIEQLAALGYIEELAKDRNVAVTKTVQELRYNLGEAYQDDDRYLEARDIFRELCAADPDEQRFAVHLFFCCQALDSTEPGMIAEMRRIVDDLDGRRRTLHEQSLAKLAEFDRAAPLNEDELWEYQHWRNLARYQPSVVDFLKAEVLTAEKRYEEALAALDRVSNASLTRPGLLLQTADLYMKLRRWSDAEAVYQRALDLDPDNAHAHIGMCRMALRRRSFESAAQHALDALQRIYHYPLAHFLLGLALTGMQDYDRAAASLRAAISFNPNFPEAHVRLAALLEKRLADPAAAREHRRLARRMRTRRAAKSQRVEKAVRPSSVAAPDGKLESPMPPLEESLIVVSGLPRSGTSMVMQMLAAGGIPVLTDGRRQADEDNPQGYLEYEPVKNIRRDPGFLRGCAGKAVKIVAPLLGGLPPGLPCRVIFMERDLDEVLDSQQRMIARRGAATAASKPEGRALLRQEYARTLARVKAMLAGRPLTTLLVIDHAFVIAHPAEAAAKVNEFLGTSMDTARMAAAVDPALYRNRR